MRRYETITIIDPDLSEEERKPVLDRISELISQQDGFLAIFDEWGSRRLAYDIKKKSHGYYVRVDYCGTGTLVDEMERFFRIDERILKYMTVLLEDEADIESIKNEIALAENEAKKAAIPSETEPDPIPEETAESDSPVEDRTESATPGDDTESVNISAKTADTETDIESEEEQTAQNDETGSEQSSEITAEPETKSEEGSEDDQTVIADSKKEE